MPIIDTRQFAHLQKNKKKTPAKIPLVVAVLVISATGYFVVAKNKPSDSPPVKNDQVSLVDSQNDKPTKKRSLKTFTPEEFNVLALSMKYPNTRLFDEPPPITSNSLADQRIRDLAEARGYTQTSMPDSPIQKINEPRLDGDDLLQPLAAKSWTSLSQSAEKSGIRLSLVSAYRSPEYQRNLFLGRIKSSGVTVSQIIEGRADNIVKSVLLQAALPGYSRHHTGYTIDLWCEDGSTAFLSSACFEWISKDNYKNAKLNGWIPSYPEGVELQGPEPEPWEYVWASDELLYE